MLESLQNLEAAINRIRLMLPLWNFVFKNRKYYFNKPMNLEVTREDDYFYLENENLNLFSYGNSFEEALQVMYSHIVYFVDYYSHIPLESLTLEAQQYKGLFENLLADRNL